MFFFFLLIFRNLQFLYFDHFIRISNLPSIKVISSSVIFIFYILLKFRVPPRGGRGQQTCRPLRISFPVVGNAVCWLNDEHYMSLFPLEQVCVRSEFTWTLEDKHLYDLAVIQGDRRRKRGGFIPSSVDLWMQTCLIGQSRGKGFSETSWNLTCDRKIAVHAIGSLHHGELELIANQSIKFRNWTNFDQ
jgi:hypothetical protein